MEENSTQNNPTTESIVDICNSYSTYLNGYLSGNAEFMKNLSEEGNKLGNYITFLIQEANAKKSGIERRMFLHEVGNASQTLSSIPFLLESGSDPELERAYKQKAPIFLKQTKDISRLLTANLRDREDVLNHSGKFSIAETIDQAINYTLALTGNPEQFNFEVSDSESLPDLYSDKSIILATVSTIVGNSVKYAGLKEGKANIKIQTEKSGREFILRTINPYDTSKKSPNVNIGQNLGIGTSFLSEVCLAFEGSNFSQGTHKGDYVSELRIPQKYLDELTIRRFIRMKENKLKNSLESRYSQ